MKHFFQLKWDLLIIILLLAGLGIYAFYDTPWVFRAKNLVSHGSRPPDRFVGDILLILPSVPSDKATKVQELDCSYGWYNALWQHYGSFATAKLNDISPELLAGRFAVIIPESVSAVMSKNGLNALQRAAESGTQILVEMPTNVWSGLSGITQMGALRKSSYVQLPTHPRLEVPLIGKRIPFDFSSSGSFEQHLLVDGEAALVSRKLGKGRVIISNFQVGCNLIALQQGNPQKGMSFGDDPASTSKRSPLNDVQRKRPLADELEKQIFKVLESERPVPHFSPFPSGFEGAISVIHPMFDDAFLRSRDVKPGVFMAPKFRVPSSQKTDFCIWSTTNPDTFKIHYFENEYFPFYEELSIKEQIENCRVSMAHNLQWDSGWLEDFSKISGSSLLVDLSLGPGLNDRPGYVFGTGFPFYPIDQRGLPFPVMLQPLLFTSGDQFDELDFFIRGARRDHQIVGISFPTNEMKNRPRADALLVLQNLETLAKENKQWLVDPQTLIRFLSARRRSILTSQWFEDQRRLAISVKLIETKKPMALVIPSFYDGESIESLMIDGKTIRLSKLKIGNVSTTLELSSGRHSIEVRYPPKVVLMRDMGMTD